MILPPQIRGTVEQCRIVDTADPGAQSDTQPARQKTETSDGWIPGAGLPSFRPGVASDSGPV